MSFIEMELREIQINENTMGGQIIVLGEKFGDRGFPIFIGLFEAHAMNMAVQDKKTERPMTHDLIYNILDGTDHQLVRVCIDALKNDTYHGKLVLRDKNQDEIWIDTRPSDAIILAAKRNIPIFVHNDVLKEIENIAENDEQEDI